MAKYFLAKILFLFSLVLFFPVVALAQVNFSDDTKFLLEGYDPDIAVWVKAGASIKEMTVYPTYLLIDLYENSNITLVSYDRYTLTVEPGIWAGSCYSDRYEVKMVAAVAIDGIEVTPGEVCNVPRVGGAAPVVPVVEEKKPPVEKPVEKPIEEMSIQELKAKITEIQTQIVNLRTQLINLLKAKIDEIQDEIAKLKAQLQTSQ